MITIPLLVCLIGGVAFLALSAPARAQDPPIAWSWLKPALATLALVCFGAGLLVTLARVASVTVF